MHAKYGIIKRIENLYLPEKLHGSSINNLKEKLSQISTIIPILQFLSLLALGEPYLSKRSAHFCQ